MATVPGIKYDDGLPGVSANCFPVRGFLRQTVGEESDGAWLVAQRAEQRRRFKAILCAKPKTYARIKEERRRAEKQGTSIAEQFQHAEEQEKEEEKDVPVLDGFFLMRHCCVEDPSDLCSVNIAGKEMTDVKEDDLALFDNVAYVNASENYLSFDVFRGFPILRELEMPLNGLRSLKIQPGDYPTLEVLDLSYNNLSQDDVLKIGLLPNLKVLHLTGNGFRTLPQNMGVPHVNENSSEETTRYSMLEILLLDDNKLDDVSVFAALAGLPSLKHLNLEKNEIYYVPMLKSVEGKVVPNDSEKDARRLKRSARKSGRKSAMKSAQGTRSSPREQREATLGNEQGEATLGNGKGEVTIGNEQGEATQGNDQGEATQGNEQGEATLGKEMTTETPQPSLVSKEESGKDGESEVKVTESAEQLEDTSEAKDGNGEEFAPLPREISEIDLEKELTESAEDDAVKGAALPPFPDLRVLNLAHNKIEDEEALLAVAAWPMLVDLIIHNNPLTTENSGDPPLLQRFLGDRLGIRIRRKKEPEVVKPPVEVKVKKSRHVTSVVPKIPKMAVEDLLMLEAPKPPPEPKPHKGPMFEKLVTASSMDTQKPLPPITLDTERDRRRVVAEDIDDEDTERIERQRDGQDQDAFFLTQVDGQEEEGGATGRKEKARKQKPKPSSDMDKYKGYEILLTAEDDPEYKPPKDIHGNIKALKYALDHELVYRDPKARLDRISKPVEPYRKQELKMVPRVTQAEKKEAMLTEMRDRVTTDEVELDKVLYTQDKHMRRKFPDAETLLAQIQRRYNAVRVNSMKEAREAKRMLSGAAEDLSKVKSGGRRVKMDV